jgi:uncharacterized protein YukE
MSGDTKVSTSQIGAVADKMDRLNKDLHDVLKRSEKYMNDLQKSWEGKASSETISGYQSFAKKYFESYQEMIDAYVVFLRKQVQTNYFDAEKQNINVATRFTD